MCGRGPLRTSTESAAVLAQVLYPVGPRPPFVALMSRSVAYTWAHGTHFAEAAEVLEGLEHLCYALDYWLELDHWAHMQPQNPEALQMVHEAGCNVILGLRYLRTFFPARRPAVPAGMDPASIPVPDSEDEGSQGTCAPMEIDAPSVAPAVAISPSRAALVMLQPGPALPEGPRGRVEPRRAGSRGPTMGRFAGPQIYEPVD